MGRHPRGGTWRRLGVPGLAPLLVLVSLAGPARAAALASARGATADGTDDESPPVYDRRSADPPAAAGPAPAMASPAWPARRRLSDEPDAEAKSQLDQGAPAYGWQIVGADAAGLIGASVLGATLSRSGEPGLETLALSWGTYLLAAPLVHAVHGHPGRSVGSLFLHMGAPFGGAFLGLAAASACGREDPGCVLGTVGLGILGGMVAATVIDAVALARATPPEREARLAWTPTVHIAASGTTSIGLAGRF